MGDTVVTDLNVKDEEDDSEYYEVLLSTSSLQFERQQAISDALILSKRADGKELLHELSVSAQEAMNYI